jgi:hypothetical protein
LPQEAAKLIALELFNEEIVAAGRVCLVPTMSPREAVGQSIV